MNPAERAVTLIQFLLGREPSSAEAEKFTVSGFDADRFLIELLCSDEAAAQYGDVTQYLIDHIRAEAERDVLPHKLAHDLTLAQEELAILQAKFDRMHSQMIDLLRHEDRIAGLFEAIRATQSDINAVRLRLNQTETDMLQEAV